MSGTVLFLPSLSFAGNSTVLNVLAKIIQSNHTVQLRTYHASS